MDIIYFVLDGNVNAWDSATHEDHKKNNKSDTRNLNEDIKILVKGFKEIQIVLPIRQIRKTLNLRSYKNYFHIYTHKTKAKNIL